MRVLRGLVPMLAALAASCAQPVTPGMPWLRGVAHVASNDVLSPAVLDRMEPGPDCEDCPDYGGIEVIGDVAPTPGNETILAAYTRGVVVLDAGQHVIASRPGFAPSGSVDEILAVVVADAPTSERLIAVAIRTGGRREFEVRLEIYQVKARALELVFRGVVEEYDDEGEHSGSVTFGTDGIHYTAPRASSSELLRVPRS